MREFFAFYYAAGTWKTRRKVIAKLEVTNKGQNPHFIVTSWPATNCANTTNFTAPVVTWSAKPALGVEPHQGAATGAVCQSHQRASLVANQFRLLLSSLAYVLMEGIRRLALKGTELARAQMTTIRLKLFKIGAVIIRNT
jgi:hypothetical protein